MESNQKTVISGLIFTGSFDFITIVIYPDNEHAPRRMSKKAYSKRAGMSERALRQFLNGKHFPIMEKMGYSKKQRMLSLQMVAHLDKILAITPGDE